MYKKDTQHCLAAITDPGLFERLATAVLREADPKYRLLIHSGVNLNGKPVRSPVDGITFVPGANPPHMIAVHHTTGKREDLEKKWLLDPDKVKPRKDGKPTAPPGDIITTARLYVEQKQQMSNLQATLILTTNEEPQEALVRKINAAVDAAGIHEVIIWSRSALAHFLDYDAKGQWIRSRFLGIQQERLSDELLHELSQRSLQTNELPDKSELWIDCQLDQTLEKAAGRDVVFIVAESGLGKSVACYKRLMAHVAAGGFGLVMPHEIIAGSPSLEQALDVALRQLHSPLVPGSGSEVLALVSERNPLLMVVEDINKSGQPALLIERLVSWSRQRKERTQAVSWQLLCPVWPRILTALGDYTRKQINELVLTASSFTQEEGTAAVRRRQDDAGFPVSPLEAQTIASALGLDPLLIALHSSAEKIAPEHVIQTFIDRSLERLAENRGEFTAGEYREGLSQLAVRMLELHRLDPSMTDVVSWFGDAFNTVKMIRYITHSGEIIRIVGPVSGEQLAFRHDRVRDCLLVDAAADLMRHGTIPEVVLMDPYFAEIIGAALLREQIPMSMVSQTGRLNPLALFCAMRFFGEPTNKLHSAILKAAETWLDDEATHGPENNYLRWSVCRVLSETDAPYVTSLIKRFHKEHNHWWGLRASFRNGDFFAGIELCYSHEPGVGVVGHLELIEHVKRNQGTSLIRTLDDLLRSDKITLDHRSGALRLAGHLGDPKLAGAIKVSWSADTGRDERLADYLWAGAQCCGDDAAELLAPVCDSWAALPDETGEDQFVSPRDDLAADQIRWAFRDRLPGQAISYFIKRAQSPELRWPITYMLHDIDHPEALEFLARELAATDDRLEGTGGFSTFTMTAIDDWVRRQEETGQAMSDVSRDRLRELWTNQAHRKNLRKCAFRLWCSTTVKGDIPILQTISTGDDLEDLALFQRLRRGDRDAIAGLIDKLLQDNRGYWWQTGRYIWSDELTKSLEQAFVRRGDQVERTWQLNDTYSLDWILSQLLMEIPTRAAEDLLITHWDHLCFSPYYVQAALYTATPCLLAAAAQAITGCPAPESMFKHITMHFGFKTKNRTGITRIAQIEVLLPYLDHLDDSDILTLWEICNSHGWFDLRRQHLDTRVKADNKIVYVDDNRAMKYLDDSLSTGDIFWAEHWTERFLETGVSIDHMMEVVKKWLSTKTDIRALTMAADIVIHGQRRHINVLSCHNIDASDRIQPIIDNAYFELKRRSLN
ncbi:MAG: hypothetical protein OXI88_08450 [Gammaproteobacteria bacterium]|nr:hypothetical protein [Gammaproteobacteria bacterium]